MSESDKEFVERYAQSYGWAVPDRLLSLARKGAEADALRAEVERLRAALKWINEPGSSLAEVINHARAALGDTHERE